MENGIVRIAVVGVDSIGKVHINAIKTLPGAKLTAVHDVVEEYAKNRALENGLDKWYTDYDQMLADGGFDCVIICSPDKFHVEQSVKALRAGYHVLCEKPLTMTLAECDQMVKAAKASDKVFMVGQVCRKTPGFVKAKEMVDAGEIGELFFVESEYAHDYSLLGHGEWRRDPNYLRHAIVGGGIHAMDLLRWIAGDPLEVFAYSNHKVLTDWPVDDCTISVLKYPKGVIGKVFCSIGCHRPYTMRTVLYGTKGTIIVDNTSPYLTLYNKLEIKGENKKPEYKEEKIPVEVASHNMSAEIQDMCDVIQGKMPLEIDAVQGANSVALCLAAVESAATGLPVKPHYFK